MVRESHQTARFLQAEASQTIGVLLVIAALVTAFWWPTLFEGKSLVHGDSIVHGLPLMDLHSRALHGEASVLWSEQIYGGHPIFAEGQGAFAHPLNIVLAAFVPPIYGHNLFHFICMLLGAIGAFGLCRALGASVFAAGIGALVFGFAGVNIGAQQNLSIGGSLTWIPWTLWAMEAWYRRPDALRALLLGAACCLMILAGYPQLFHGTVVYMAVSLLVTPFSRQQREVVSTQWRRYLGSGVLAVLLCCGLAAVQLLPLFELVGYSHRNEGVGLFPVMPTDIKHYLRGFMFTLTGLDRLQAGYFPVVGSSLVCVAATLALVFKTSLRCRGHLLATLLLLQLGVGVASPVFTFFYMNHLLPGLEFFRIMSAYLSVATAGIAVLAALGLDALLRFMRNHGPTSWCRVQVLVPVTLFIVLFATTTYVLYAPGIAIENVYGIVVAVMLVGLLFALNRTWLLLPTLFVVLAAECLLLHLHEIHFVNAAALVTPPSRQVLAQDGLLDQFRFVDRTARSVYAFVDPRDPAQERFVPYVLAGYAPMTNLLAQVAGFQGATALPLRVRMMLDPAISDELEGRNTTAIGQRIIDLLALRYVTTSVEVSSPGFTTRLHDSAMSTWIMENSGARPRFQTFTRHTMVATPEQALHLLQTPREDALLVEGGAVGAPTADDAPNDPTAIKWTLRYASSTKYVIDVDAARAGWFFLADANYPGWVATIDGRPTPVFSAQVLGKAVAVTQGQHRIELWFDSVSFRWGLWLTLCALLVAVLIIGRHVAPLLYGKLAAKV